MEIFNSFKDAFFELINVNLLGLNLGQYLIFFVLILISVVFNSLIANIIVNRLKFFVRKTVNKIDDKLFDALIPPCKLLPLVIVFFILSAYFDKDSNISFYFIKINNSLVTIFVFWFMHQLLIPFSIFFSRLEKTLSKAAVSWIINSIKYLIIFLGIAALLETWGIKVGPIIAGLGLLGVAVALGAQDLFKNLISGILVLVEKRFKIGDWILVDGIIEGIVEKIGFRSTTIRKFDKSLAIIPNFQFAENAVINVSETSNWLISWVITLQYDTTVEQLKTIRDEIENHINKSDDFNTSIGVAVRVDKFSDSSIDMYVRCFTKTDSWNEWLSVKERLAIEIKQIVENNKASFAFPSQSIYVEKK